MTKHEQLKAVFDTIEYKRPTTKWERIRNRTIGCAIALAGLSIYWYAGDVLGNVVGEPLFSAVIIFFGLIGIIFQDKTVWTRRLDTDIVPTEALALITDESLKTELGAIIREKPLTYRHIIKLMNHESEMCVAQEQAKALGGRV